MKFILGKKLGMTQIFQEDKVIPVTLIESGPNFVAQVKNKESDGYEAVKLGFGKWLREFRVEDSKLNIGDKIDVSTFAPGDKVAVVAVSKGKGFQGVVKRHGFHGGPKSHGQKDRHRAPGSIGTSFPEHVIKGKKMAGRMGTDRVTVKNLEIVEVDNENNLIALKGAVPGRRGTLIIIKEN